MLNDTLLTAEIPSAGAARSSAGRIIDTTQDSSASEKAATEFTGFLELNAADEPAHANSLGSISDYAVGQHKEAIDNPRAVNENSSSRLGLINSASASLEAELAERTTAATKSPTDRQRALNSTADLEVRPQTAVARSPEHQLDGGAEIAASSTPTPPISDRGTPPVNDPEKGPTSKVVSGIAGSFQTEATPTSVISQRYLTPDTQQLFSVGPPTNTDVARAPAHNAASAIFSLAYIERPTSPAAQEFQRAESSIAGQIAGPELPQAANPDWRPLIHKVGAAFDFGARPATHEQQVTTQGFRVTLLSKLTDKEFELRLDPPDLGSVTLQFHEDDAGVLRATVTSERSETLDLLRRHSDILQRELARAGAGNVELGFQDSKKDERRNDRLANEHVASFSNTPQHQVGPANSLMLWSTTSRIDRFV